MLFWLRIASLRLGGLFTREIFRFDASEFALFHPSRVSLKSETLLEVVQFRTISASVGSDSHHTAAH